MANYGNINYWDNRYTMQAEQFDWYSRFFDFKDLISEKLSPESTILIPGSGTSSKELICY